MITLYFTPDLETARTDDFTLMRQVNNNAPETLVRQVLPDSTNLPFFRYYILRPPAANQLPRLALVPAGELPTAHTLGTHGDAADAAHQDRQPPGSAGELRHHQRANRLARTDAADQPQHPAAEHGSEAAQDLRQRADPRYRPRRRLSAADRTQVKLTWVPAFDENSGEKDVVRYVIWRKKITDPTWTRPADLRGRRPGQLHLRRRRRASRPLPPTSTSSPRRIAVPSSRRPCLSNHRDSVAVTTTRRNHSMGTARTPTAARHDERGIALLTTMFVGMRSARSPSPGRSGSSTRSSSRRTASARPCSTTPRSRRRKRAGAS